MSGKKSDKKVREELRFISEGWLRQQSDPDYLKNLESKLGGPTEFLLLTRESKKPPRCGLLVASRHLVSSFKVIPCIRIRVHGAANTNGYESGCSVEISAWIIY